MSTIDPLGTLDDGMDATATQCANNWSVRASGLNCSAFPAWPRSGSIDCSRQSLQVKLGGRWARTAADKHGVKRGNHLTTISFLTFARQARRPAGSMMGWNKIEVANRGAASGRNCNPIVILSVVVNCPIDAYSFSIHQTASSPVSRQLFVRERFTQYSLLFLKKQGISPPQGVSRSFTFTVPCI